MHSTRCSRGSSWRRTRPVPATTTVGSRCTSCSSFTSRVRSSSSLLRDRARRVVVDAVRDGAGLHDDRAGAALRRRAQRGGNALAHRRRRRRGVREEVLCCAADTRSARGTRARAARDDHRSALAESVSVGGVRGQWWRSRGVPSVTGVKDQSLVRSPLNRGDRGSTESARRTRTPTNAHEGSASCPANRTVSFHLTSGRVSYPSAGCCCCA